MKRKARALLALTFLAVSFPTLSAAETIKETTRRLALVAGANFGGPTRERLRYAISDAKSMLQLFEAMGGVGPDDSRLLVEPDRETFLWEMGRLQERIRRARSAHRRVEIMFYYSGHSDENNILLGREKISYQDLRRQLEQLEADVRIVILDSCASGAFIRTKGGKKQVPFLFDNAYDMKGYAVMTSSSADEASQESDHIRSSFFTHHLLAGLRGAADSSQDGCITFHEAYQYAFRETLTQTEKTVGGPQHPSYNIQMSGTGDVVITDIRKSASVLRLGGDIAGRVFIHTFSNNLVMELLKMPPAALDLGLGKGKYRVITINGNDIRETSVELADGQTRELTASSFKVSETIDATARGDQQVGRGEIRRQNEQLTFFVGFFGKLSRYEGRWSFMPGMVFGMDLTRNFSLGLSGFGKTAPEETSRPPFWGIALDYKLYEKGRFGLKCGTIIGFMYKDKQDEFAQKLSTVLEPGFGLTWTLNRKLQIISHFSLDFINGTNDNLRRFSLGVGLLIGKR